MKCEEYSKMMTDLLAGELSGNEKKELDAHLAGCESCMKEFEALQKTWNLVTMSLKEEDLKTENLDVGEIEKAAALEKPEVRVQDSPAREKAKPGILFFDFRMMLRVAAIVVFCGLAMSLFILPALRTAREEPSLAVHKITVDLMDVPLEQNAMYGNMPESPEGIAEGADVSSPNRASTVTEDSDAEPSSERKRTEKPDYPQMPKPSGPPPAKAPSGIGVGYSGDSGISNDEARGKAKDYNKKAAPSNKPATEAAAARSADLALPEVKMDSKVLRTSLQPKFKSAEKESQEKSLDRKDAGQMEEGFDKIASDKSTISDKKQEVLKRELKEENGAGERQTLRQENEESETAASAEPSDTTTPMVYGIKAGSSAKEAVAKAPAEPKSAVDMPVIKPSNSPLVLPGATEGRTSGGKKGLLAKSSKEAAAKSRELVGKEESEGGRKDNLKMDESVGFADSDEMKPQSPPVEMITKTYEANLKLWDMTDEKTAREFLKMKNAKFAGIAEIKIDLMNGKITLKVPQTLVEEADKLFSELRKAEEKMKENKDGLPFIDTKQKPFSTFSIDVDTASYTMAAKLIRQGIKPEPASIRPEEFINYFDYHYSPPKEAVFGITLEASPSPFRPEHCLFRIGVKARTEGAESGKCSALTFVIDASGSMARDNRLELVKKKLPKLFEQLNENDRITVIVSRETPQIIARNIRAADSKTVEMLINDLRPAGVANLETGIVAAYDSALHTYVSGAYNRVVIITDGISNIGSNSPEVVLGKVDFARRRGITNTVLAVGGDGDDKFLETIADKGDGNYVFISDETEAERVFTEEFAAMFHEVARDVKIQVEFRPETVAKYRQVGYQNRQLSKADFRNDSVDAGEVGSGQSVTALYEMILDRKRILATAKIAGTVPEILAVVRIRYRSVDTMEIEEREFFLDAEMVCDSFEKTSDGFKLAASVAEFAEYLEFPDVPHIAGPQTIRDIVSPLISSGLYGGDNTAKEFYRLSTMVN